MTSADRHVGISFGKVRTWHDGLGEFSLQLGRHIAQQASHWQARHGVRFHFHLPLQWHGHFGPTVSYIATHEVQRWLHWQPQTFALWHSLHQHNPYAPPWGTAQRMETVHDANFLYLKSASKQRRYLRRMQRRLAGCDMAVAISRYVRDDVVHKLGYTGRIQVIHNGVRDLRSHAQEVIPEMAGEAFFLHISRLAPSKNVEALLGLASAWPGRLFVLAGGDSPYARDVMATLSSRQLSNVKVFLDVTDAQKAWLYAHCEAFLFPSLAEGFGLPPIEAMHFGKPVFLSRLTSLPEIGGSVAHYWDEFDPASMRDVMERHLADHTPAHAAAIEAHACQFNWDTSTSAYLNSYAELMAFQG